MKIMRTIAPRAVDRCVYVASRRLPVELSSLVLPDNEKTHRTAGKQGLSQLITGATAMIQSARGRVTVLTFRKGVAEL